MTKFFKITLITISTLLILLFPLGCAGKETSAASTTNQMSTVKRGNISVSISASGNLKLSDKEDMAFGMDGTVGEVSVLVGDSVKKGQVLATLDASQWSKRLQSLQQALETAQRNLDTKTSNLGKAQRQVTAKELAVEQAQLDLRTAEDNIKQIAAVKTAQDAVDDVQNSLRIARAMLQSGAEPAAPYWSDRVAAFENNLALAQNELKAILNGTSIKVASDVALQVSKIQLQVKQSKMNLEDAQIAVDDAKIAAKNAQSDKEDAEQAVKDARSDLDEAKVLSPTITAPFDGYITKVSVAGGDAILKGKVAMQVADSSKFEADFNVNEMDIYKIGLDTSATVTPAALSTLSLQGKITSISPTATTQSGVVNYAVVAEVSLPQRASLFQSGTGMQMGPSQDSPSTSNQTSGRRTFTGPSGAATSNQTAPQRTFSPQGGTGGQANSSQGNQQFSGNSVLSGTANQTLTNFQLRDGLSVSVNILVASRTNVLLVPNRAITRQGRDTIVRVVKDGVTESRTIQIGINDLQNTEVISGLNEGEEVAIPQSTTTTSSQSQPRQQQFVVPGLGGMR